MFDDFGWLHPLDYDIHIQLTLLDAYQHKSGTHLPHNVLLYGNDSERAYQKYAAEGTRSFFGLRIVDQVGGKAR